MHYLTQQFERTSFLPSLHILVIEGGVGKLIKEESFCQLNTPSLYW